jgi:fatty-acyl-CoA synthase
MMDFPLNLSTLYERAVRLFPNQEVVSVEADRSIRRTTYAETDVNVRKLATVFEQLDVDEGQAVGTFAWNNQRHHELYWATANTGRICHTLNIRLFPEQLEYIINHGEDQVIFVDPDLVKALEPLAATLTTVRHFVVLGPDTADTTLPNAVSYDDLLAAADPFEGDWPRLDERSPHMYCYTSGTTGNPKGVAYTQRSTYMHTISGLAFNPMYGTDVLLPVVPQFHAAAWGFTFMATTVGAKIVMPGPDLSAPGLVSLIEGENVTVSAGVPTVWLGIQSHLMEHPQHDMSSIRTFLCGGSAVPRAMIDWYYQNVGIKVVQGWGMTETNPLAAMAFLKPDMEDLPWEEQLDVFQTAGLPLPGLRMKIVDEDGAELPEDGAAFGELLVQGPWIAAEYFKDPRSAETMGDGWLKTGDVCKITPEGYVVITDRSKDVIKSGGEWISSLDLENTLMAHPKVAEAAVVGIAHEKWQERPLGVVVMRPGETVSKEELTEFLSDKCAKWWLPDDYVFIDELPKTGTGKFDKKVVRDQFSDLFSDAE